jgi:hypothetical protein
LDLKRIYDVGSDHLIVDQYESLVKDEVVGYYVSPKNSTSMKISLVWTDVPGTTSTSQNLVNNLDLKVTDPFGNVYLGNYGLETSKWSSLGGSADILNNVENVFIETPDPGSWLIEVIGTDIDLDGDVNTSGINQHFALVVSYEPDYFPITLWSGWNLISLPLVQSPRTDHPGGHNYQYYERLETVLRSIGNNYSVLQYYDAGDSSDNWKHFNISKPDHMNDLKVLGHRMGFWIYVTGISDPDTITLKVYGWNFTENQTIKLWSGWDMVGYPSTKNNVTRTDALNNLIFDTDIDKIQYFVALTDTWVDMDADTDKFVRGRGYWFHYIGSPSSEYWEVPYNPI